MEDLDRDNLSTGTVFRFLSKPFVLILFTFLFGAFYLSVYANDPPHNEASGIDCSDCHGQTLLNNQSPFYTDNNSETAYNNICLGVCHTDEAVGYDTGNVYNGSIAPLVLSHTIGATVIKCTVCHHNHDQDQIYVGKNEKNTFFLATGTLDTGAPTPLDYDSGTNRTTLSYDTLIATDGTSLWADLSFLAKKTGDGRGAMLVPNYSSRQRWPVYLIKSIDTVAQTITVKGNVTSASNLGVFYGQLVRRSVNYEPVAGMPRSIKFYDKTEENSFAHNNTPGGDDTSPNNICQICHTQTNYWHNDGTLANHFSGEPCMVCHPHTNEFIHPDGGGVNCEDCHNSGSHTTHIKSDDPMGPRITCPDCHALLDMPYFKSGTDGDSNGHIDITETNVCDSCHSPDGPFDGVDDATFGARPNWASGVYTGSSLTAGKEKWCVSCHDPGTSIIQGRQAPDVAGDNTNYGYYISGHGRVGAAEECAACHGLDMDHNFDGQKTYLGEGLNDTFTQDPLRTYKLGFRLKDVAGMDPLFIPLPNSTGYVSDSYKLCYSCHDEETLMNDTRSHGAYNNQTNPYRNAPAITTQFRNMHKEGHDTGDYDMPANFHADHLIDVGLTGQLWYSNGPGTLTGRSANSCPMCHNPHGDKRSDNTATIAMTAGAFDMVRSSDAFGDYGEVTNYGPFDSDEDNPNPQRRCVITCHTFGRNGTSETDTNTKWYYNSTIPDSIALSDNDNEDPGPADPGFTNSTDIRVRPVSLSFTPTEIMCAEDNAFTINVTPWDPFQTSTSPYIYTLLPGDGSRTVYCKTRNTTHSQESAVQSATIILDTNPPVGVLNTTLTAPNGSEIFAQGSSQDITWNNGDFSADTTLKADPITLDYSTDSGGTFPDSIASDEANDGTYNWVLPLINSSTVRVRITVTDKAGNQSSDTSDGDFAIQ